jgi:putative oxidoreductase
MHHRGLFIAARILVPMVFVGLGLERLAIAAGLAAGPPVSVGAAVFSAFELAAGIAVMAGWKLRWIAGLLAVFIVVDAFLAHPFWAYPADERHGQLLHFLKNFATLGGLLALIWADLTTARPGDGARA